MEPKAISFNVFLLLITVFAFASCRQEPYITEDINYKGYVIGKETCHIDETQNYWLIDFTYLTNSRQVGDTMMLNGITYINVAKVKGLSPRLKEIGMKVSIDAKTITPHKIATTSCGVANPITYLLKEMFIINQGEIRG